MRPQTPSPTHDGMLLGSVLCSDFTSWYHFSLLATLLVAAATFLTEIARGGRVSFESWCQRLWSTMDGRAVQSLWWQESEVEGYSHHARQEAAYVGQNQGWV